MPIVKEVSHHLQNEHPVLDGFWRFGQASAVGDDLMAHADYVYSLWLTGREAEIDPTASERFVRAVAASPLAGSGTQQLTPHLTAYLLGAANLLAAAGHDYRDLIYESWSFDLDRLVDPKTRLPRWPWYWSHHTWRVSHWIGGIPSILLNFARHDPRRRIGDDVVEEVLTACDGLLSRHTGLLRAYDSAPVQVLFRSLYRLRHDPDLGDIGGVVHIHWINHAFGRNYVACSALLERAEADLKSRGPFLEGTPYCLDFDYIQLLRTGLEQVRWTDATGTVARAAQLSADLYQFLLRIPGDYHLHRLPGALAALHETAFISAAGDVPGLGILPRDVIKAAYWL